MAVEIFSFFSFFFPTFFFSIQLYVPIKIISTHMRRANQYVGRQQENPERNHLVHPQEELGLSQMWSAWLEPTPDTAVR